jgi:hypothetical protein
MQASLIEFAGIAGSHGSMSGALPARLFHRGNAVITGSTGISLIGSGNIKEIGTNSRAAGRTSNSVGGGALSTCPQYPQYPLRLSGAFDG